MGKKKPPSTRVEETYEEVRQLLGLGKERGYLAYDEINEMLPEEVSSSPEDIEEIFSLFEAHGIELVDADTKEQLTRPETPDRPKEPDKAKIESPATLLEKTNDPVRMYLREMGTVPLLTREGEVSIARRIERFYDKVNRKVMAFFPSFDLMRHIDCQVDIVRPNASS